MELLQLKYFCDAANTQNFSDTAKKFGVPSSGISQTIKRLEQELDTELFLRGANKVTLSNQGKLFFEGVSQALSILENTKKKLKDSENTVSGEIRLLVLTNRRIVTEAIENFKANYGNVKFLINHNPTDKKEIYDLIISDEETDYKGYGKIPLITERILLAARKENNITKTNGSYSNALKTQSFITMPKGSSLFRHTNLICSSEGFAADIAIECDDPFYLRKYVELGLGIAFVPEFSWQGMFSNEVTLIDIGNYRRNTFVFHNYESYQTKTVRIFLETLLKHCKSSFG